MPPPQAAPGLIVHRSSSDKHHDAVPGPACASHASSTGAAGSADGDAVIDVANGGDVSVSSTAPPGGLTRSPSSISVYDLRSSRKRSYILLATAIASVLVPFTDTIYLPALQAVGQDLAADASLVAASVSIYMLTVGMGSIFWGPMADRFGRRITYMVGSVGFMGTTLGCIFAPTIGVLVAFRALQGFAVATYTTTGQGAIADVFRPEVRGTALGMFMIPLLVGPLAGPVLGGVLSQLFGWRSTFICLVVFAGGVVLPLLLLLVPETHQYRTMQRLRKRDPAAAMEIAEAHDILSQKPVFSAPWVPLRYLVEGAIAPYALLCMCSFGCMFASLTEWPGQMAGPPYHLSEAMIGVSYLAMGVAGLVGSPVGGRLSDVLAARWPLVPEARLPFSVAAALVLMPIGLIIYGWTLHLKTHLVGPLVGHFVIGVASAAYLPGVFGYISTIKQQNAAAAAAAVHAAMFMTAAVLIYASVAGVQSMGIGWYFTLLAGIQLVLAGVAAACIWRKYAQVYRPSAAAQQQQPANNMLQAVKGFTDKQQMTEAGEASNHVGSSAE